MERKNKQIVSSEMIRRLSGKLLLYEELPLDAETISQLLKTKLLSKTPAIIKQRYSLVCQRCHNQKPSLFGIIPCAKCKKEHPYCRHCLQMGRILFCEPLYEWTGPKPFWTKHKDPCQWNGRLTNDQSVAAQRIVQAITNKERELLIWAVTGSGKTEMLFPGITKSLQLGLRVCIATPRVDVVRELYPRLHQAFQKIDIEALYGGSEDKIGSAQLIIATTHQLLRYKHAFDVLVIDEIDAFPYDADPALSFAAKRAVKKSGTLIYLTATPRKSDQRKINNRTLAHVFIPRRFHNSPLPVPHLKTSYSLNKQLKNEQLPKVFTNWFVKREQNGLRRQLLIFLPTISLAERLAVKTKQYFAAYGKTIQFVHAEDDDREEKIASFRQKKIDILMTTTILERGVTFPAIDVIVLDAGHDVFNTAALVQIAGRAGRHPADPTGEVLFIHDGKTKAMVEAIHLIKRMNRKAGFK